VTLAGTTLFSTYLPSSNNVDLPCVPSEGSAKLYPIQTQTGKHFVITTITDANGNLPKPGLPGEINVLSGTNQAVGNQVYSINAKDSYRASWRERLGETQK
jgi:hypothetical protein